VIAHSVATNTVQGSITSESVATDMAINGDGFFVVSQLTGFTDNQPVFSGVMDYTRAGDFQLNANGNLVNGAGYYLMGVPVDPITGNPLGSAPTVLQFNNSFVPAQRDDADSILGEPSCQPAGHAQPEQLHVQPGRRRPDRQLRCGIAPNAVATGTGTVAGLSSSAALINGDVYTVSLGTNTTSFIAGASAALRTLGGNDALIALQGIEEPAGRRRRAVKHATARSMARRAQCGSLSSSQSRHGLTRNYLNSLDKLGRPGTARSRVGGPVICGIGPHHRYCHCHRPSIYRPASRGRASHR